MAWYCAGYGSDSKLYLRGPYSTSFESERESEKFPHPMGEPFEMNTIDLSEATRRFKEKMVGKIGFDKAVKRVGHKI